MNLLKCKIYKTKEIDGKKEGESIEGFYIDRE